MKRLPIPSPPTLRSSPLGRARHLVSLTVGRIPGFNLPSTHPAAIIDHWLPLLAAHFAIVSVTRLEATLVHLDGPARVYRGRADDTDACKPTVNEDSRRP